MHRILFEGNRAVGVEAESGGETFIVEADKIVLSAGALKSPHILMLSGVGPRDQLDQFGIPVVHEAPGIGQNLWNHAITTVSYKVKDGTVLAADNLGTRIALRYTAEGSPHVSDMMMTTSSMFNALTGETIDDGTARVSCVLELPEGSGWVRLASPTRRCSRPSTTVTSSIPKTRGGCVTECAWRQECWRQRLTATSARAGSLLRMRC